jgi:hypothetical protein
LDEDLSYSPTQRQLESLHSHNRKSDKYLEAHLKFMYGAGMSGVSDHDLLFTEVAEQMELENEVRDMVQEAKDELMQNNGTDSKQRRKRISKAEKKIPLDAVDLQEVRIADYLFDEICRFSLSCVERLKTRQLLSCVLNMLNISNHSHLELAIAKELKLLQTITIKC